MGGKKDNTVFIGVQAALLNSDCDPVEAGIQGLCALYTFVATELVGSPLAEALADALTNAPLAVQRDVLRVSREVKDVLPSEYRKELRNSVLALRDTKRTRK